MVSARLRAQLICRDGEACVWCGESLYGRPAYATRLLAAAQGVPADPDNLVLACRDCWHGRGQQDVAEYTYSRLACGHWPRLGVLAERLRAQGEGRARGRRRAPAARRQLFQLRSGRLRGEGGSAGQRRARIRQLLARDGGGCVWCGRLLPACHPEASFEHLQPRALGGDNRLENLVLACRDCNRRRGLCAPLQFLQQCRTEGWLVREQTLYHRLQVLAEEAQQRWGEAADVALELEVS